MHIGLDFDGVIADSTATKIALAQKLYSATLLPSQWRRDIVLGGNLLTSEQYDHIQELVYGSEEYGYQMTLIDGTLAGISELTKIHSVTIVTSRIDQKADIATNWCKKNGISLPLIGVGRNKSKAPHLQGFDVFVDDSREKLEQIVGTVPHLFLFDEPYNKDQNVSLPIIRTLNWDDLLKRITTLEQK